VPTPKRRHGRQRAEVKALADAVREQNRQHRRGKTPGHVASRTGSVAMDSPLWMTADTVARSV